MAGRPYSEKITQVIADLARLPQLGDGLHPLLQRRPVARMAIVHITPDNGLCGGLPTIINRMTANYILGQEVPAYLVTVGRKGFDFMRRFNLDIRADFTGLSDRPSLLDTLPISRILKRVQLSVTLLMRRYRRFKKPNLCGLKLPMLKASQFHRPNIVQSFTKPSLPDFALNRSSVSKDHKYGPTPSGDKDFTLNYDPCMGQGLGVCRNDSFMNDSPS